MAAAPISHSSDGGTDHRHNGPKETNPAPDRAIQTALASSNGLTKKGKNMFKKLAIAATAVALTAGAASANNTFGLLSGADQGDSYYDVNVARTLGEGSIQIETFAGDVLGMASVNEGTNTDVRVDFDTPLTTADLVAKLIVDGEVVDESRIVIKR